METMSYVDKFYGEKLKSEENYKVLRGSAASQDGVTGTRFTLPLKTTESLDTVYKTMVF